MTTHTESFLVQSKHTHTQNTVHKDQETRLSSTKTKRDTVVDRRSMKIGEKNGKVHVNRLSCM